MIVRKFVRNKMNYIEDLEASEFQYFDQRFKCDMAHNDSDLVDRGIVV